MVNITWFLSFSNKNDAESCINFVKIPFLDPKRAKLDQKSEIGHVRTCQDLSKRTSTYCKPAEILLFFQVLHLSIFIRKFIIFIQSSVLLSKYISFYNFIGFTKEISHLYKIIDFTKRFYHFYSWLHKLRNTQGKIHGTYLGNIYIYIWNI